MDTAVSLVESYLRLNGFLTATEFSVLAAGASGDLREVTDIDIVAVRFPGAGLEVPGRKKRPWRLGTTDAELACSDKKIEMLLCEVKEGDAVLNPAFERPETLAVAIERFGLAPRGQAPEVAERLLRKGETEPREGSRLRILAFGSTLPQHRRYLAITLDHVVRHLRKHLQDNWGALSHAKLRDPNVGLLALLEKVERAGKEKR